MERTCMDCSDPESSHGWTDCLSPFWPFHDCTELNLARNAAPHLPSIKKDLRWPTFPSFRCNLRTLHLLLKLYAPKHALTKKYVLTLRCCQSVQKIFHVDHKAPGRERGLKWFQRHNSFAPFFSLLRAQILSLICTTHSVTSSLRRRRIGWNRWRIKSPTNLRWHFIVTDFFRQLQ